MEKHQKLINKVVSFLENKKFDYEISKFLTNERIDSVDSEKIINKAKEIYMVKKGKKRKIIWVLSCVLSFILFYFLIPNSIYNISPLIISFIGAALLTFFLIQSVADFKSWEEFNTADQNKQDWRHQYTPFLIIPGLIMVFVFSMHFSSEESSELKEFGVKVKGNVIDGTSYELKRGKTFSVTIKFKTTDGNVVIVSESVGEDEFLNLYKGKEIELIYSKKDPKIIELLTSESTIRKYTGSEERDITPKDLISLLEITDSDIEPFLNQINYGWKFNNKDSIWLNENSNTIIKLSLNREIKCITFGSSLLKFPEILKNSGFHTIESEVKDVVVFESDTHNAFIQRCIEDNKIGTLTIINKK